METEEHLQSQLHVHLFSVRHTTTNFTWILCFLLQMAVLQLCSSLTIVGRTEHFWPQTQTLAVVNKGLNVWQKMHMERGPGDWNKMAHVLHTGNVFCWEIHSPLRWFSEVQGILTYAFSIILSSIGREMDNTASDNRATLYYTEPVTVHFTWLS
jgi:hypothetical protein